VTDYTEEIAATIRNDPLGSDGFLSGYDAYLKLLMHMNASGFPDVKGHTVTDTGSVTLLSWGQFGKSGGFNGSSQYLTVTGGTDFAFGTGDFTVMIWGRMASNSSTYLMSTRAGGSVGWRLFLDSTKIYWGRTGKSISGTTYLDVGTFYQYVVRRASGVVSVYVNGAQHGSSFTDSGDDSSNVSINIGLKDGGGAGDYWNGQIDEIAIWNGVAIPISELYPQTLAVDQGLPMVSLGHDTTLTGMIKSVSGSASFGLVGVVPDVTIKNIPDSVLSGCSTSVEAIIINRPILPSAVLTLSTVDYLISGSARQSLADKMMQASFSYDLAKRGELPETYFNHVKLVIPDYNGVNQTVFTGIIPSSASVYGAEGQSESFVAFDYSWYLTMQYLTPDNLALLVPADQLIAYKYRLYYHNPVAYWKVGQIIQGVTGGGMGKILENHLVGAWPVNELSYVILEAVSGDTLAGHYFVDGEALLVNGVLHAYADGHEMNVTGVISVVYPHNYVARLLGRDESGSEYESTTGIYPYRLTPLAGWSASSTPIAIEFDFEERTTKMQAIDRLCKYLRYIFIVKSPQGIPLAYFIPESDIDDPVKGLDLPTPVEVTPTSPHLMSPVSVNRKGEERYNKVTVRCQSLTGEWFESVLPSTGPDEIPIEYIEINPDLATQTDCDLRCADLYAYYVDHIRTWNAKFVLRSDLRLLQKLIFTGNVQGIPNDTYRIVGIEYKYADGGTVNAVECTLISDNQFTLYLNLSRVFTDSISEIQSLIYSTVDQLKSIEAGVATSVTNGVVSVTTESGVNKIGRDPSV